MWNGCYGRRQLMEKIQEQRWRIFLSSWQTVRDNEGNLIKLVSASICAWFQRPYHSVLWNLVESLYVNMLTGSLQDKQKFASPVLSGYLTAAKKQPKNVRKSLFFFFSFASHLCVLGVVRGAEQPRYTPHQNNTVNKTNSSEQCVRKKCHADCWEKVKEWELTSSASILFSRRSSSLGLQRQKRTYCKKGKNFINQRERGLNLDLFGWGLAPCCCAVTGPRAERSRRKTSRNRDRQVWRDVAETKREILTNSFCLGLPLVRHKKKWLRQKKKEWPRRRRLWFNPFFVCLLRRITLSVRLSNHLAARLRFHIHSGCLSGKAWLTALMHRAAQET